MKCRVSLSLVLLAASALTFAADKEVEALLTKMRDAYKAVKTAKLSIKATLNGPEGKQDATSTILFAAPNKVHATSKGLFENDLILISDGKEIALEGLPDGRITREFSMDMLQGGMPANLEVLCFWDYARQLSTGSDGNMHKSTLKLAKEKWNDKEWTVLEEEAAEQQVYVRYFIDPKTSFIWRTVVYQIGGKDELMDVQVTELEVGAKLDEAKFKV